MPFIVAGAGGYNLRLHTLSKAFHKAKLPIEMTGSDGRLENFCDSQHGYLRITVTKNKMVVQYFAGTRFFSPGDQTARAVRHVEHRALVLEATCRYRDPETVAAGSRPSAHR